jgi:3-methyladenine DNA glycosylase AlkD
MPKSEQPRLMPLCEPGLCRARRDDGVTPHRMSVENVLAQLEAWGSATTRRVNTADGAGDNQFGVKPGTLRRMADALTSHHTLALKLWATGNADAMILATMLLAPDRLSMRAVERMVKPLTYPRLVDEFTFNTVSRARYADFLRERWMASANETIGRAGWNLLIARVVRGDTAGLDPDAILATIEAEMPAAFHKQEAMNRCLVEIAARIPALTKRCRAIVERLGPMRCTPTPAPERMVLVLKRKK